MFQNYVLKFFPNLSHFIQSLPSFQSFFMCIQIYIYYFSLFLYTKQHTMHTVLLIPFLVLYSGHLFIGYTWLHFCYMQKIFLFYSTLTTPSTSTKTHTSSPNWYSIYWLCPDIFSHFSSQKRFVFRVSVTLFVVLWGIA